MSEHENTEIVEVVYSIDSIWQVVAIFTFGLWLGFVCGMGASFGRIEFVASEKPRIEGNVTVQSNGKPVYMGGFYIDMSDREGPAISIDTTELSGVNRHE